MTAKNVAELANFVEIWGRFKRILESYPQAFSLLNGPCSLEKLRQVERQIYLAIPSQLQALLTLNNGQQSGGHGTENGIFKSFSGWNSYQRHVFLGVDEIGTAYQTFISDRVLLAEFGTGEIPFAVAGSPAQFSEAFCIDAASQKVSLIWTQTADPFNPPEWQVQKFWRAESLMGFIEKQMDLYR